MSMNILQRINEVRKKIDYIQKDKSVSTGGGSYKAVTHDAVTGMVRKHLIDNGVVIIPSLVKSNFHPKEEGAKQRLYEATYDINFANIDNPDDRITLQFEAHALDNGDKAPGKAISYATKAAILKLFNIETGEDDESRYQQDEFEVDDYVQYINNSNSLEDLQRNYTAAVTEARKNKDRDAERQLIAAKDARKRELSVKEAA